MPVPGGGGGFGVLDELAVGGVLPGTAEQDRRARRDPERGGCVLLGRTGGMVLVDPGCAAPGYLGDVCQGAGGQGLVVGEAGCPVGDGRGIPGDGDAGSLAVVAAGFGAAQGAAAGGDAKELGDGRGRGGLPAVTATTVLPRGGAMPAAAAWAVPWARRRCARRHRGRRWCRGRRWGWRSLRFSSRR